MIADAIEKPRAEVYTRPQMRELAARYFAADDVGAIEGAPPFLCVAASTTTTPKVRAAGRCAPSPGRGACL